MLVNAVTHSYAWLLFALVGICSQKKNKGLQLIGKLIAKALERLKTNKQTPLLALKISILTMKNLLVSRTTVFYGA